jgi:hypothetical protein
MALSARGKMMPLNDMKSDGRISTSESPSSVITRGTASNRREQILGFQVTTSPGNIPAAPVSA